MLQSDLSLTRGVGANSSPGTTKSDTEKENDFSLQAPSITLPKGGGALKSIDEKFQVNAVNGTASFSLPLPLSNSRNDFIPGLSLNYNSGSGNSEWGLGWQLSFSSIQRRTEKQLPQYNDGDESDVFMFSGAEDLVPVLILNSSTWVNDEFTAATGERVKRYRPRIESGFSRIEQISAPNGQSFYWKVTSRTNVVTIYGRSPTARISDPADPKRVFKWLPELSYGDKGDCFEMEYIPEDLRNVVPGTYESNRFSGNAIFTNRYLKRAKYGNKIPYYPGPANPYNPIAPIDSQYFFEVVFDFGDHDINNPTSVVQQDWPCRLEPFSNYKPGFELRTYRLCQRVLMFHYFAELNDGVNPAACLIRSLDLSYRISNNSTATPGEKRNAEVDYIIAARQSGYLRNGTGYDKKSLPPIDFSYQELNWDMSINEISETNTTNDPPGTGSVYQWADLWSEGISGLLTEQASGWYYKNNLGNGHFSKARSVLTKPSFFGLSNGRLQLQDLEADGRKFIVSNSGPVKGYFELSDENDWQTFQSFRDSPNLNFNDPDLRMIDLNGDGRPDIIISDENVFTWYANKGTDGFDAGKNTLKPWDEEKGPAMIFLDPLQTIFLTDMTGDGMSDIVRIRNGEICYWPNKGYGKFGSRVSMDNAPVFDLPDLFNPSYLHLADINGTGATDIFYLGQNRCVAWLNLAGNRWSEPLIIDPFPNTELPNQFSVLDLLGNGTVCIVWSSGLPAYAGSNMRYIDLLGGKKPFIMNGYKNNFGKQVSLEYKSSTHFYLQDKLAGRPWVTKLPFPVQCLTSTTTFDLVTQATYTQEYIYHEGYYDHPEGEFRGFGMVEQTDTERYENYIKDNTSTIVDDPLYQAPVLTKTWFHTGAYFGGDRILDQFAHQYFQNPNFAEYHLPASRLPEGMWPREMREALRACKGMVLRQEIYALDDVPVSNIPYSIASHNCNIQMLQPGRANEYAVFLVTESEAISYYLERNTDDPRISHSLNIEIDDLGNPVQSASVVYPRKQTPANLPAEVIAEQQKQHIIYLTSQSTQDIIDPAKYRLRVQCESQGFELTGISPSSDYFQLAELKTGFQNAALIRYEEMANGTKQKRLIAHQRSLFLKNDCTTILPFGQLDSLGLNYESYKKTLTLGILTEAFGARVSTSDLISHLSEGKYIRSNDYKLANLFPGTDADDEWWIPSGTKIFPLNAASQFYLPEGYKDPFGNTTTVQYYSDYFFLIAKTTDPVGNTVDALSYDWRVLSPERIQDINDNISEVRYDILGHAVGSALMGKGNEADDFLNFDINPDDATIAAFFNDPVTHAPNLLQHATSRFIYDFTGVPVRVGSILRETHYQQTLLTGNPSPLQLSFEYSDGLGNTAMTKVQAEPGLAKMLDTGNNVIEVDTSPNLRWIGNGRTVLNNKGKPVKQYEPYFSNSFQYENDPQLVEIGVTPVLYYDPLGRLYKTVFPNGSFSKTEFDAWQQVVFDQNDTVNDSDWYQQRTSGSQAGNVLENQAALKASVHYNTPLTVHADSLGRSFYSILHNRYKDPVTLLITDRFSASRTVFDVEGNPRSVIDARGNSVLSIAFGMTGNQLHSISMDAGERWMLTDCIANPIYSWDSKDQEFQRQYDARNRLLQNLVKKGIQSPMVFTRTIYGEGQPNDKMNNLRGQGYQYFDQVGIFTNLLYDFKGNTIQSSRQLCSDYTNEIDWNANPNLETEIFNTLTVLDALNRTISSVLPDSTRIEPGYNQTGLLTTISAKIKGVAIQTDFVKNIKYDSKSRRTDIFYGNSTKTAYQYDPFTFRIIQLLTTGNNGSDILQKLSYTYDPVGNITNIKDEAQQTIFFNNNLINPSADYTYDAIYQLIVATGREHIGQNLPPSPSDSSRINLPMPGEGQAMRTYVENYEYDSVGNIMKMIHAAGAGSWTRSYTYESANNRLLTNSTGANTETLSYDVHGNIVSLISSPSLIWNFKDELQKVELGGGGVSLYVYDGQGQRIRKIIERQDGTKETRIYFGSWELYRKINPANSIQEETQTVQFMDGAHRIAMVETRTIKNSSPDSEQLIRYQYSNHLGSSSLELDDHANIISYEEYYTYGSTSYQAMNANIIAAAKRYRYTGMERDEETGLEYHSARYYLPWLGRWLSADPIGIDGGLNVYRFCSGNPIINTDSSGRDDDEYCMTPGCGTPAVGDYLKDALFGTGEGIVEEGKDIAAIPDRIQESIDSNIQFAIDHPSEAIQNFVDNMRTAPKDLLLGMANSAVDASLKFDEMEEDFYSGRPRAGGRILGKGLVVVGVTVATDGIGDEILAGDAVLDYLVDDDLVNTGGSSLIKDGSSFDNDIIQADGNATGPKNKFRPRSEAIRQTENNTCLSASCKMVLRDLGHSGITEERLATVLNTSGPGAYISDVPNALRSMDIPISKNNLITNVSTMRSGVQLEHITRALESGDRVIVGINPVGGGHAVVVDTINNGMVVFRDPAIGASVQVTEQQFRALLGPKGGRMARFILKKK